MPDIRVDELSDRLVGNDPDTPEMLASLVTFGTIENLCPVLIVK